MSNIEILVVDDRPQTRKLLRAGLSSYGYGVVVVTNWKEAVGSGMCQKPDIVILDIDPCSCPNGLAVCGEIREEHTVPIVVLTVNNKKTILAALNAGADDCLTKPFDLQELEARIRAVLRRGAVGAEDSVNNEIHVRDLVIDIAKHRVTLKGSEIHLTPTEYKLLWVLAKHPGKVVNYETLIEVIKGKAASHQPEHNLRVRINMLRKKLQDDSADRAHPRYIKNEPGLGYRFADVQPLDVITPA